MRGYKPTHLKHPMTCWAASSLGNYRWTVRHGLALCRQYTLRYHKIHATTIHLEWLSSHEPSVGDFVTFVKQQVRPSSSATLLTTASTATQLKKHRCDRSKLKIQLASSQYVESMKTEPIQDDLAKILQTTPPPQCMPDVYRCSAPTMSEHHHHDDNPFYMAVCAYRRYYIYDKSRFAQWNHAVPCPYWWQHSPPPLAAALHNHHEDQTHPLHSSIINVNDIIPIDLIEKEEKNIPAEITATRSKKRKRSDMISSQISTNAAVAIPSITETSLSSVSMMHESVDEDYCNGNMDIGSLPTMIQHPLLFLDKSSSSHQNRNMDAMTLLSSTAVIEQPRLAIDDAESSLWCQSYSPCFSKSQDLTTGVKKKKVPQAKRYSQYISPLYCGTD